MTDPIASKPNEGSEIATDQNGRMIITPEYQRFLDDLEEENNKNVSSIKLPIHAAGSLPDVDENVGGFITVSGTLSGNFLVPCYASSQVEPFAFKNIVSVTNPGGITQFNYIGNVLSVNSQVVISDFLTNPTYNGKHTITNHGVNFFQVSTITFTGTEIVGRFRVGANWRDVLFNQIVI